MKHTPAKQLPSPQNAPAVVRVLVGALAFSSVGAIVLMVAVSCCHWYIASVLAEANQCVGKDIGCVEEATGRRFVRSLHFLEAAKNGIEEYESSLWIRSIMVWTKDGVVQKVTENNW